MSLAVHSILVLDKKAVGVRFKDGDNYRDVEVESLRGLRADDLWGYKTATLIPQGDLLVTKEELQSKITITDASQDKHFCEKAFNLLKQGKPEESAPSSTPAPASATSKPTQKSKGKGKGKGKVFDVVVSLPFYNPDKRQNELKEFQGEFEATNALVARKKAKEFYAEEFSTDSSEIQIISAKIKA